MELDGWLRKYLHGGISYDIVLRWEQEGEAETIVVDTAQMIGGGRGDYHWNHARQAFYASTNRCKSGWLVGKAFKVTKVEVALNERFAANFEHRCHRHAA